MARHSHQNGADGAGSTVREQLGLDFEGMTWPERFVATTVYFDFERYHYARGTFFIDDDHGAVIAKIDNAGLWRCTYMQDAGLAEETFLGRPRGVYGVILPGADYEIERAVPYRMHQRMAPRYRLGRVVLAGDAAHVTNPTGGLGLTSGLLDCFALCPALASVISGGADPSVLDRYSDARKGIFLNRVSPQTVANKQLIFHANWGQRATRRSARGAASPAEGSRVLITAPDVPQIPGEPAAARQGLVPSMLMCCQRSRR